MNKFYFKGKSKINNNLIINRNNNFNYEAKNDVDNLVYNKIYKADYKRENLIINKTINEFFMKIKRKKKLKKKKTKRFKFENLFISDYNQLYIKRSKSSNNNSSDYKDDINIEK